MDSDANKLDNSQWKFPDEFEYPKAAGPSLPNREFGNFRKFWDFFQNRIFSKSGHQLGERVEESGVIYAFTPALFTCTTRRYFLT